MIMSLNWQTPILKTFITQKLSTYCQQCAMRNQKKYVCLLEAINWQQLSVLIKNQVLRTVKIEAKFGQTPCLFLIMFANLKISK